MKSKAIIIGTVILLISMILGLYAYKVSHKRVIDINEFEDEPQEETVKRYTNFPIDDTSEYTYSMTAEMNGIDGEIKNVTIKLKDKPKIRKDFKKETTFFRYNNVHDDFTDGFVVYTDDNKVKIYDDRTQEIYITNIASTYDIYSLISCNGNYPLGIEYYKDKNLDKIKTAFVTYEDGTVLYKGKYNSIEPLTCNVIKGINYESRLVYHGNIDSVTINTDLISPKEEKVYRTIKRKDKKKQNINLWVDALYNEKGEFYIVENNSGVVRYNVLEFLTFNGTEVKKINYSISGLGDTDLETYVKLNEDGTLTYRDEAGGVTTTFDTNGNAIKQIDDSE